MFLAILGIIAVIVSYALPSNPNYSSEKLSRPIRMGGIGLVVFGLLMACFKQIDAGEIGVQKLFGRVSDSVLESGLNFVNPLVDIISLNGRTQNYTMSSIHDEGQKGGDDAIRVLSNDGLEVVIDLTVLYHVNKTEAPNIIREIGANYEEVIVRPVSRTKIRDNAVFYPAIDLYSIKREEFQRRIYKDIDSLFRQRGLTLEQLLIRNITLPTSVKQTIESKINAEQDAQKMQFVLLKEKQEAERKRVEAQGIADYQRILSLGLSDKMLQYEQIKAMKELSLSQNSKVVVMGGKSGGNILISSDK
jgi:regulator of protease activity HflC (stomatin/prohibitin superfamily)